MQPHDYHALAALPEYKALVARRQKLVWPLLLLTVAVYFLFILAIAFRPEALGHPVGESVISIGIWLGLGIICFNFVITGIYVHRANRELEALSRHIHDKASEMSQ